MNPYSSHSSLYSHVHDNYNKTLQNQSSRPIHPSQSQKSVQQDQQNDQKIQMVIDFGPNGNASLIISQSDDPLSLAKIFCFKNNLNPHIIATLADHIRNLQNSTFQNKNGPAFKIQRNNSLSNKENIDRSNYNAHNSRSGTKSKENNQIRMSTIKKTHSNVNDSILQNNGTENSSTRLSVFQRLYHASRRHISESQLQNSNLPTSKHNQSRTSLNTTSNKSLNQSSISSCLHVYEKNTKLREQSRKHSQHLKQLNQQKQIQECIFKPQINALSKQMANKMKEEDYLRVYQSAKNRQIIKIKQYLLQREAQEMKECTFQPKIINNKHPSNSKRFLELHQDHQSREHRKNILSRQKINQEQSLHHPEINTISRMIVNSNFQQRLQEDTRRRTINKISQQKDRQRKLSAEKRPTTGRPPANRDLGDKTIGQYLYEKAKASRTLTINHEQHLKTNPKSQQIHTQVKQTAFQYLFELLDSDRDGLISSSKINITSLRPNILKLLAPLLCEMEDVEVQLNQQEFSIALDKLFSTLNITQKNEILKTYKDEQANSRAIECLTFQPTINQKSLLIARQLCQEDTDIYEQSRLRMKQKDQKLSRMRAERILQQYSECSFHPQLHP